MEPPKRSKIVISPPPRKRPVPPVSAPPSELPADPIGEPQPAQQPPATTNDSPTRKPKKARKTRAKREKRIIKGDHPVGYGRPPVEHQFKERNKGGPGRPRGSKSQNTLLRAELDRKHTVREGGKTIRTSSRELITRLAVTEAITRRNHKELVKFIDLSLHLYPDPVSENEVGEAYDPAFDQEMLQNLFASLQLGEAAAQGIDPLADRATGRPDLGQSNGSDAWDEGDWDGDPGEAGDEDR